MTDPVETLLDITFHGKVALCFLALAKIADGTYKLPISISERVALIDALKEQLKNFAKERIDQLDIEKVFRDGR